MALKLIGAGFGRTGTLSIKGALEELGFGKCYHMRATFENAGDAPVWQAAAEGKPVDWDALLEGYQATVDWPGCTFYRTLMERYPDAKVLLNVRDPEAWYKSASDTIYRASRPSFPRSLVPFFIPRLKGIIRVSEAVIWQKTFDNRFEDKAYALKVFSDHIEEVKRVVPADKLLVYEVKEGWGPLCAFLGVPVPDKPFPRLNDSASFNRYAGPRLSGRRPQSR